jgi:hypothetical protein
MIKDVIIHESSALLIESRQLPEHASARIAVSIPSVVGLSSQHHSMLVDLFRLAEEGARVA